MKSELRPGLTVAVMVRDDADRLRRCLASVEAVADEVVVLDTGSQDESVAVAEQTGARVRQIEWPGAFDIALNQLLEMVETAVTFRLDSDEWLDSNSVEAVKAFVGESTAKMGFIFRKDIYPEDRVAELRMLRLWRTDPRLRYVGAIHEHFTDDAERAVLADGRALYTDVVVHHDGYAQGMTRERYVRNLELIRTELEIRPGQPYYEACQADTLIEIEGPESAAVSDYLKMMMRTHEPHKLAAVTFAKWFMALKPEQLRQPLVGKALRYASQHFSDLPMMVWAIAETESRRENHREALEAYLTVDRLGESGRYDATYGVNRQIFGPICWQRIVELSELIGRKDIVLTFADRLSRIQ
ncbi:MAG: glycosyltransferase [Armatimonadetes bacterium]|nr:glycosyltransferase [Armatimonadota bacterium]